MCSGSLLIRASKALKELIKQLEKGNRISEKEYQRKLFKDVLTYTAKGLEEIRVPILSAPYKRVFVILPSNVPHIGIQLLPLLEAYRLEVFFKLPSREKLFMKNFLQLLRWEKFEADYLSYGETLKKIREYDFVVAFGSSAVERFLKAAGKPYRFFGPKFSFAFAERLSSGDLYGIMADFLSFDTEGCLSTRFLFVKEEPELGMLEESLEKAAALYPPQNTFDVDLFYYYSRVNLYFSKKHLISDSEAVFFVERMPEYFPPRTLFLVKIDSMEDVVEFLGDAVESVQAITTSDGKAIPFFESKTSVSLFLKFGRSQFPPIFWLFEKGVTLENFFEVNN